jgi:Mu-like prophage major head subunit gpT
MSTKNKKHVIAMMAPVTITAAEGDAKSPPKFDVTAYTGGQMDINGWDLPIVIDLAGLDTRNSLVANLDHQSSQRVGNVNLVKKSESELQLSGFASAATPYRDEVVKSAADGFVWQASVEVQPKEVQEISAGKSVEVNGQKFEGPLYVTRKGTLRGFAFVSHGADDNTSVTIAATADKKEKNMEAGLKSFIEAALPGTDISDLSDETVAIFAANYEGKNKSKPTAKLGEGIEARKADQERIDAITETALDRCEQRPYDTDAIGKLAQQAIDAKWSHDKFRLELIESTLPVASGIFTPKCGPRGRITDKVLEAAVCQSGRLGGDWEKKFDDQTLQTAHSAFKDGIGLQQLFLLAAQANGYSNGSMNVDVETQRAAFGMKNSRMQMADGFTTVTLPNVLSNVANKFLMEGWMAIDQTPLRIAKITPVRDFKTRTTVSLTGGHMFSQVGADGEIKHSSPGELVYTNSAGTYATMCAITRTDIINDDLGALTEIPRRIGRGGMLKLNDIFWTTFLNNSSFFSSGNSNVSTGATTTVSLAGIALAETVFMNQTDPDGFPLGIMPSILLAGPTNKTAALTLMNSQYIVTGANTTQGSTNVFQGRYTVESSPYMENSNYTGYSTAAWYLLADPQVLPVIEIVALNGRVEPTVETATAEFDVLGVQMRGYSDIGVSTVEKRGGVRSAGS